MSNPSLHVNIAQDKQANQLVEKGLSLHQKGEVSAAAECYQEAISLDPHNTDALHLLGMLAFQINKEDESIRLISTAIALKPKVALYHNNIGTIFFQLGQFENARESFSSALKLNGEYLEAKFNLANAYRELNDNGMAEIFYVNSLGQAKDFTPALKNLAELYLQQGRTEEAISRLKQAMAISPNDTQIKSLLSEAYVQYAIDNPGHEDAYSHIQNAIALNEKNVTAQLWMGDQMVSENNYAAAKENYLAAIRIEPDNLEANYNLGVILNSLNKPAQALKYFQKCIDADSEFPGAQFNLANTCKSIGEVERAKEIYENLLAVDEKHYGALVNLSVICGWNSNFEKAVALLRRAEQLNSENYIFLNNFGMTLQSLHDVAEAEKFYRKAIALNSESPEAYWNLSLLLLLAGRYKEAWPHYEKRWELSEVLKSEKRNYSKPLWTGEDIKGKTLFIYCEQGYGDCIQFSRFIPQIIESGVNVVLECPESLSRLFVSLHQELTLISPYDFIDSYDCQCPLMSLPAALNLVLEDVSISAPYLSIDQKDREYWGKLLGTSAKLKIGIVWLGNPRNMNSGNRLLDTRRSCQLESFRNIVTRNDVEVYSLQKDDVEGQLSCVDFSDRITDYMSMCGSFYDTAALLSQLDLVISVDTSVAHLAGALNKPIWLLSRYDGCWRWLLDRQDSPWYPSMKIFRQEEPGDWSEVFKKLEHTLDEFVENVD